jgi:hypothetical protein
VFMYGVVAYLICAKCAYGACAVCLRCVVCVVSLWCVISGVFFFALNSLNISKRGSNNKSISYGFPGQSLFLTVLCWVWSMLCNVIDHLYSAPIHAQYAPGANCLVLEIRFRLTYFQFRR